MSRKNNKPGKYSAGKLLSSDQLKRIPPYDPESLREDLEMDLDRDIQDELSAESSEQQLGQDNPDVAPGIIQQINQDLEALKGPILNLPNLLESTLSAPVSRVKEGRDPLMRQKDMEQQSSEIRSVVTQHYVEKAVSEQMTDVEKHQLLIIEEEIARLKTIATEHELEFTEYEITQIMKDAMTYPDMNDAEIISFVRGIRASLKSDSIQAKGLLMQVKEVLGQQNKATKDLQTVMGSMIKDLQRTAQDIKTEVLKISKSTPPRVELVKVNTPSARNIQGGHVSFSATDIGDHGKAESSKSSDVPESHILSRKETQVMEDKHKAALEIKKKKEQSLKSIESSTEDDMETALEAKFEILGISSAPFLEKMTSLRADNPQKELYYILQKVSNKDWSLAVNSKIASKKIRLYIAEMLNRMTIQSGGN